MGLFHNPYCIICGASPMKRNDKWLQDFCPKHKPLIYEQYLHGDKIELTDKQLIQKNGTGNRLGTANCYAFPSGVNHA